MSKKILLIDMSMRIKYIETHLNQLYPENFEISSYDEQTSKGRGFERELPDNYDIYLIKLNMSSEEAVEELLKQRPDAHIRLNTSMEGFLPNPLVSKVNGTYAAARVNQWAKEFIDR